MLPLRDRAQAILSAATEKAQSEQLRWQQNDKPSLKQYARGLQEALALQHVALAAQQTKVAALASQQVDTTQTHSGFNVIRARLTNDGKPLPTEDLRAERNRLTEALNQLAIDIAASKAEIKSQRRTDEIEIWETQLVALQDTLRVYRQEINMIEVELLGRDQQERIEREKVLAEASGQAQLQRLQDQELQTRIRMNRAKQQYHFPTPLGYNITFGGGGIYGAFKDITLSEVFGGAEVTAEILSGPSPSPQPGHAVNGTSPPDNLPRARLTIQFGKPKTDLSSLAHGAGSASSSSSSRRPSNSAPSQSWTAPECSSRHSGLSREASGTSTLAPAEPAEDGSAAGPGLRGGSSRRGTAPPPQHPSRLSTSARTLPTGAAPPVRRAATSVSGDRAPQGQLLQPGPALMPGQGQGLPPVARRPSKAKALAVRFLNKIGSKKEKYQGQQQPQLQPSEPSTAHAPKRTLASKLLHRKPTGKGREEAAGEQPHTGINSSGVGGASEELLVEEDREEGDGRGGERGVDTSFRSASLSDAWDADGEGDGDGEDDGNARQPLTSMLTAEALQLAADAAAARAANGQYGNDDDDDDDSSSSSGDSSRGGCGGENSSSAGGWEGTAGIQQQQQQAGAVPSPPRLPPGMERGSWLRQRGSSGVETGSTVGGESSVGASSDIWQDTGSDAVPVSAATDKQGVHVVGRVAGFGLVGERGSKVPNLSLGQGDVEGNVFVRFVFEYTTLRGWHSVERPQFNVTHLKTRLRGNNVPMPDGLVKTILRTALPGLIQRKLMAALPRELGSYLLSAQQGFHVGADVALLATPLSVLDADLAFEVKGPARSAAEAKKEQQKYAAAKEARRLLGLSLPQAQVLAEVFRPRTGLLDLGAPLCIYQLIELQRFFDRQPQLYAQLCQVLNTGYQLLAERLRTYAGVFSFRALMDGPVSRMRRKPARVRVLLHDVDVPLHLDALLTAVRDYLQRSLEELIIKGPQPNMRDNPEFHEGEPALEDQLELLHAWHAWMLQELSHFKSKFLGAGGTLLGAASARGFSAGVENAFYEGPLRIRVPVTMTLDADGAFTFDIPLPSPEGAIGEFVDVIKSRLVPAHLRPPHAAVDWVPPTGDSELDSQMRDQVARALASIQDVLDKLAKKVEEQGAEAMDKDPVTALSQPRTMVGDRLGRMIVNRLRVHVRLDEQRISEILQGIDSRSMGAGFLATAGRILGHLGDVVTLGFTPAAPALPAGASGAANGVQQQAQQYLFQFESSDVSRLRADVQSLGFQSLITPGGAVRLVHAVLRGFLMAFKRVGAAHLTALDEKLQAWYQHMSRESLDMSLCMDLNGSVQNGGCVIRLSGAADESLPWETSPLMAVNELELRETAISLFGPGAAAAVVSAPAAVSRH